MTFRYQWYNQYINDFLKLTYDHYANFLPAVFVTYYKNIPNPDSPINEKPYDIDSRAGYSDPSKPYSPNRFIKIENFPIFLVETLTPQIEHTISLSMVNNPISAIINSRNLIIPTGDDYICFSTSISEGLYKNKEPLFRITNVEPANLMYQNALQQDYQSYKVTLLLSDSITSVINRKVVNSYLYLDKFNFLLPEENINLFMSTYSLMRSIESYLVENIHRITNCVLFNEFSIYDLTKNLIAIIQKYIDFIPFKPTVIPEINYSAPSIIDILFDDSILIFNNLLENYELLEKNYDFLSFDSKCTLFKRRTYIPSINGINILEFFYPSNYMEIRNIINHILADRLNQTMTLIDFSNLPFANIYNSYINSVTTKSLLTNQWTNPLEAILLYKYCGQILWTLINL